MIDGGCYENKKHTPIFVNEGGLQTLFESM
jgi:hypothetical protein